MFTSTNSLFKVVFLGLILIMAVHSENIEFVSYTLTPTGGLFDPQIDGGYAYMNGNPMGSRAGFLMLDISQPSTPDFVGFHDKFPFFSISYPYIYTLKDWHQFMGDYRELSILDITDPDNPIEKGHWRPFWGLIFPAIKGGEYVYAIEAGEDTAYLWTVDVSDPSNPHGVGECPIFCPPRSMAIDENKEFIYLVDARSGEQVSMQVVDVSNPAAPKVVTTFNEGSNWTDITISGNYAYIYEQFDTGTDEGGLWILNISDPLNPQKVVRIFDNDYYEYRIRGSGQVFGSHLYVAGDSLRIVDIGNPALPLIVSSYKYPVDIGDPYCGYTACAFKPPYAYLSGVLTPTAEGGIMNPSSFFEVVDISNPIQPKSVGSYVSMGLGHSAVAGPFMGNQFSSGGSGFQLLDISDPTRPRHLGYVDYPTEQWGGGPRGLAMDESFACVTYAQSSVGTAGFYIIDITNPPTLKILKTYSIYNAGTPKDLEIMGSYAYLVTYGKGVFVVDISDLQNPTEKGFFPDSGAFDIAISGSYGYLATEWDGVRILDISDPNHLTEKGCFANPDYYFLNILVKDDFGFAFFGEWDSPELGLLVIDISNPSDPKEVATYYPVGEWVGTPALEDNFIYFSTEDSSKIDDNLSFVSVRLLDISEPNNPHEVGNHPILATSWAMRGSVENSKDEYIYVGSAYGIEVYRNTLWGGVEENYTRVNHLPINFIEILPNPFRDKGSINYQVMNGEQLVKLQIYDILGRLVRTLVKEVKEGGYYITEWNGKTDDGETLPTGIYFCRLVVKNKKDMLNLTKKFIFLH